MTVEEKILWQHLRYKQLYGYRFLRQHPLYYEHNNNDHFFFVPDFYSPELKLIIELDGGIHLSQMEKDKRRDEILLNRGFKTLRINNSELQDLESVKLKIIKFIELKCK